MWSELGHRAGGDGAGGGRVGRQILPVGVDALPQPHHAVDVAPELSG